MREFLDKIAGYFAAKVILGFLAWFYFMVIHRKDIKIIGKWNIPRGGRVLFYSNHPSMMDPFLLSCLFWPRCIFQPGLLPWTPAAQENFFPDNCRGIPVLKEIPYVRDSRLFAWIMKYANVIPVRDGRQDPYALRSLMIRLDIRKNVLIFPEGGRTEVGVELNEFREGIALLAGKAKKIVPIWIEGAEKVLPKGQDWPKWSGNKITIIVGKPLKKSWWRSLASSLFLSKKQQRTNLLKKMREELLELKPAIKTRTS